MHYNKEFALDGPNHLKMQNLLAADNLVLSTFKEVRLPSIRNILFSMSPCFVRSTFLKQRTDADLSF